MSSISQIKLEITDSATLSDIIINYGRDFVESLIPKDMKFTV